MKRRKFIGLIGASALSLPFFVSDTGLGSARRNNRFAVTANKVPMRIRLPKDAEEIAAQLGATSKKVYLLGGTAAAAAAGLELPYLNLLMDTPKFTAVKQSLFEFGVVPLPTPELPGNLARFMYQDRSYNLINMKLDAYTMWSAASQERGLILFAHNYLIYNVNDEVMLDPYDALAARSEEGGPFLIKPIQQPKTLLQGFDHYLAATFDRTLLGLQTSPEYLQIEERVLQAEPTEEDSKEIMGKVLDYAADMLEVGGLDTLCQMLTSPVCVAAAKMDAEIDLSKVAASLRRSRQQGKEISGREFMMAVDTELKKKNCGKGAAGGLPEYLAVSRNQFRRTGLIHEVFEKTKPA